LAPRFRCESVAALRGRAYAGGAVKRLLISLVLAVTVPFLAYAADVDRDVPNQRRAEALGCNLPLLMGDFNGSEYVASNDALILLRHIAHLLLPYPLCSPYDIDCNGIVSSIDALKILRYSAGLTVTQSDPCTPIGDQVPP
jgi:hypothetical protein